MNHNYTINICRNADGAANQTECDGYIVMALKKEEGAVKKYSTVHVRVQDAAFSDMVNALYTDKKLRAAAIVVARVYKRENSIFSRIGRWLRGERDELEE